MAVLANPGLDVGEGACPVGLPESVPGQGDRQNQAVGEEPATDDDVGRVVQFKQEQLTGLDGFEIFAGRPPEIDLIEVRLRGEMAKPVPIRQGYRKVRRLSR